MANRWMKSKALHCIYLFFILMPMASRLEAKVTKSEFGSTPDGTKVEIYTLEEGALKARIMTYGARLVSLEVPDRSGKTGDIVLGYESLAGYTADPKSYFGSIVGRYGNRIAHASFTLDGKEYHLPANDGTNTLHGGIKGFDKLVWQGHEIPNGVELTLVSKDGDQGFPGTLTAKVRYTLEAHALKIEYFATTDKDTVLNLTNHSYFNLAGEGHGDILNHQVMIPADRYTPVDASLIPTGELAPVAGTPLDFHQSDGYRSPDRRQIRANAPGRGIRPQLCSEWQDGRHARGCARRRTDHRADTHRRNHATRIQFYSGNFLDGTLKGKHGHVYNKHAGFCLETQHFPDSPNHPKFPTSELKPGQTYHNVTTFGFSTAP